MSLICWRSGLVMRTFMKKAVTKEMNITSFHQYHRLTNTT